MKRVIAQADADGAGGEAGANLRREFHRLLDVPLKALDEAAEHAKVLLGLEHLSSAVAVCDAEVPGWHRGRLGRVPARGYVSVRAGEDHQHLGLAEAVQLLIGPPDVG